MQSTALATPTVQTTPGADNRREFPRSAQCYQVRVRAQKPGDGVVTTHGTLVNVSMGGALVRVKDYIPRDYPCTVEIPGAIHRVVPNQAKGRVVGTSVGARGDFLLHIKFVEPLQAIKEPGEM